MVKNTLIASLLLSTLFTYTATGVAANETHNNRVELTINGESESISSEAETVEEMLEEVGHNYRKSDKMNFELEDRLSDEMEVVLKTEKKIEVSDGGNNSSVKTNANTVSELLKELKIQVKESDIVIPSLDSTIEEDDEVAIIYHREREYKEIIELDYEVEKEFSFDLPYKEVVIEQEGEKGIKEDSYIKITRNEVTLSEKKLSSEVSKEPVTEEIIVGTKEEVEEEIEYETVINDNKSMYEGQTKITQAGKKGLRKRVYENNGEERILISEIIISSPVNEVVEEGVKKNSQVSHKLTSKVNSDSQYSLSQFQYHGVIHSHGKKFTYYSQSVLPGGGLKIPGRHVNAGGYVADNNGYIVIASNRTIPKGTIINTPFGYKGKVYDVCASCTPEWFDVYTR